MPELDQRPAQPRQSSHSVEQREHPTRMPPLCLHNRSGPIVVSLPPPPPPPAAPLNTTLPFVSGTTTEGQTLTVSAGSWSGSPTSYAYQWQNCDSSGASCSNVSGAVSATYVLSSNDVSHTMRVIVTATNAGGSGSAASAATASVAAVSPPAPSNTASPTVSGTTTEGQTLTASVGSWSGSPTSFLYQWQACDVVGANCVDISGASSPTYTLASSDVGHTVA